MFKSCFNIGDSVCLKKEVAGKYYQIDSAKVKHVLYGKSEKSTEIELDKDLIEKNNLEINVWRERDLELI